ncbi:hypothetical protein DPX16_21986 [Anabarilius grahami]|uniref:Uncharacterized protein n=1 Tax=Anabarilius grahami TaxID=495550 RepID=A0A3N0XML4_ANAGA|nr:hypothetical protein DPX16_21986 [Anabarilius grahami]
MITSTCDGLLTSEDAEFCKGELKLIYPDLVIDECLIIPQRIREKISKEWGSPQVQLPSADELEVCAANTRRLRRPYVSALVVRSLSLSRPLDPANRHFITTEMRGQAATQRSLVVALPPR